MRTPVVSIIIPCYNVEKFVSECLNSVLRQTVDCWEAICVNDGSSDRTEAIIRQYMQNDGRVRIVNQVNGGVPRARNRGIHLARGKYLLCLDADDYLAPEYVSVAVDYMESHPACTLFIPKKHTFDSTTRMQLPDTSGNYSTYRNLLLYGQWVTAFFRKEDCERIGGFDEACPICEDWEFCIRLLRGEKNVFISEQELYYYRKNGNPNALTKQAGKKLDSITTYIFRKHIDIYTEYFGNQLFNLRRLESLNWTDRKLPQMAHKIQLWWQMIRK